jgi:hypothetical protein
MEHAVTDTEEIVYHGQQSPGGKLVTLETPGGDAVGLLRHVVKHSPTGFNWSYRGSGPAELARCLLLDALGDTAVCPMCAGTGQLTYIECDGHAETAPMPYAPAGFDPAAMTTIRCPGTDAAACDGGYLLAPPLYQRYTSEVIAALPAPPAEWRIRRSDLRAWLAQQPGPAPLTTVYTATVVNEADHGTTMPAPLDADVEHRTSQHTERTEQR